MPLRENALLPLFKARQILMIKKFPLLCMALLLPLSFVACGGGPEKKKSEYDDEYKTRRASESVAGYNGKPLVKDLSQNPKPQVSFNENPRYLIYVGEGRVRSRPKSTRPGSTRVVSKKVPKAFVITDGSAVTFTKKYKTSDYRKLKGAVKPVSIFRFDEILRELNGMGFQRLEGNTTQVGGEAVGTLRAIHLEIDGQRKSMYKQSQEALGSKVSPRAIFTRCEQHLIKVFYPPGALPGR